MTTSIISFYKRGHLTSKTEEVSLEEYAQELLSRANTLGEAYETLQCAYEQFRSIGQVWPEQCDRIDLAVRKYGICVKTLCELIDDSAKLPEAVIPLRYQLILMLHYADEQVDRITPLIQTLHKSCRTRARQILQQRQQIQSELGTLVHNGDELQRQCIALMDRARFQERTLYRAE